MATADRVLAVLGLFTMDRPEWTVEAAMRELGLSSSTAYQYFRSLVDAGLLVAGKAGTYGVGPAVITLDRVTRRHDPLIREAQAAMRAVVSIGAADGDMIALLCRSFRLQVMCVDQYSPRPTRFAVSYERGRPMPLYRGAASKVILAELPSRATRRLWDGEQEQIHAAGLGGSWEDFKRSLRALRKGKVLMTRGEIDSGLVGISAPVFAASGDILGSLGIVAAAETVDALPGGETRVMALVAAQAGAVTARLREE